MQAKREEVEKKKFEKNDDEKKMDWPNKTNMFNIDKRKERKTYCEGKKKKSKTLLFISNE